MSDMLTKDEVVALERSYWDAMKEKDGSRTAALSGQTSIVSGPRGVMSIDQAKMGKMTEEGNWTLQDYAFDDVQVSTPAPGVAIIAYKVKQTVTMDGKQKQMEAADLSTWLKGKDGWQCHAHSETVLGGSPLA